MDIGLLLAGSAGSDVIFACAMIGALGLGAQWLAWRLQAPAIVLMSLAGLAVGPLWSLIFGEPLLSPQATFGDVFRPIVSLAVAVILFEGGLVLKFENLREARRRRTPHDFHWRAARLDHGHDRRLLCRRSRLGERRSVWPASWWSRGQL